MPKPSTSTRQAHMKLHLGMVPGVDSDGAIEKIAYKRNVLAKTSDYTVLDTESGSLITTEGATADVEFTLPALATGLEFEFFNAEDVEMKVSSAADNTIVASGDIAAGSVTFTTATTQIGTSVKMTCDGSKWMARIAGGNSGSLPGAAAVA